jgi:hypothetical protein
MATLEEQQALDQNMVDTRPVGFVADTTAVVQRAINTSITGLAETALGDVNKWREVLMANPAMLPFKLPPSLQGDIDKLNNVVAFTGLKIPPLDMLETDLKKTLGDLVQPTLVGANKALDGLLGSAKGQLDRLKQLDWLL